MLEKKPQELAIRKQVERSSTMVKDVPPTTANIYLKSTFYDQKIALDSRVIHKGLTRQSEKLA